jgi:hypothetical protein
MKNGSASCSSKVGCRHGVRCASEG